MLFSGMSPNMAVNILISTCYWCHLLCCVHTNRRQTLSFVSSFIGIWVLGLNNKNFQYNVPWYMMHCMLHWMTSLQFVHSHVCVHNQGNINNWECATQKARYCMVLLLQQYWLELVSRRNWEFYWDFHFMVELTVTGTCSTCWKYDMLLMNFLRMAPSCQNI